MFNRKSVVRPSTTGNSNMKTPVRSRFSEVIPSSASARKSTFRLSTGPASKGRPSMFKGKTAQAVDVRQLQSINVRCIYNFLTEEEEEEIFSEQRIRHPQGRTDFVNMFETIYQHLSPEFRFPNNAKLEDWVPRMLSELGYQHPIKASYFNPIGVPHNWPHLLDALAWLCQFALLQVFFDEQDNVEEQVKNSQLRLENLQFECTELKQDEGSEAGLLSDLKQVKEDSQKANDFIEQLNKKIRELEVDLEMVNAGEEQWKQKLASKEMEISESRAVLEEQENGPLGLSGQKARELVLENQTICEEAHVLEERTSELSTEMWKESNKLKEQLKRLREKATAVERPLNEILRISENRELAPMQVSNDLEQIVSETERVTSVLLPKLRSYLTNKGLEIERRISASQADKKELQRSIQIRSEMLNEMDRRISRKERARERDEEENAEIRQKLEKKILDLETEKDLLDSSKQKQMNLLKLHEEAKTELEQVRMRLTAEQNELDDILRQKLDAFIEDIEIMNHAQTWVEKEKENIVSKFKIV